MARTRLQEALRERREVAARLAAGEDVSGLVVRKMRLLPGGYEKFIAMVGKPIHQSFLSEVFSIHAEPPAMTFEAAE